MSRAWCCHRGSIAEMDVHPDKTQQCSGYCESAVSEEKQNRVTAKVQEHECHSEAREKSHNPQGSNEHFYVRYARITFP